MVFVIAINFVHVGWSYLKWKMKHIFIISAIKTTFLHYGCIFTKCIISTRNASQHSITKMFLKQIT
uniref:Candidate secreted effector n=1 Tax=Meloidogyne incognita TaxID=6306 RepID=A0A914LK68_MELIC